MDSRSTLVVFNDGAHMAWGDQQMAIVDTELATRALHPESLLFIGDLKQASSSEILSLLQWSPWSGIPGLPCFGIISHLGSTRVSGWILSGLVQSPLASPCFAPGIGLPRTWQFSWSISTPEQQRSIRTAKKNKDPFGVVKNHRVSIFPQTPNHGRTDSIQHNFFVIRDQESSYIFKINPNRDLKVIYYNFEYLLHQYI